MYPKESIRRVIRPIDPPEFSEPDSAHGLLASPPLPVYVTTSYDAFMADVLRRQGREPELDFSRWSAKTYQAFTSACDMHSASEWRPQSV